MMRAGIPLFLGRVGAVALNRPGRWDNGPYLRSLLFGVMALLPGCQAAKPPGFQPLVARFYLEVGPGEAGVPVRLPVSGVGITVGAKPVFTEYDLVGAEVAHVDLGSCLMLQLTPAAARDLYRLSGSSLGRRLVLFLNDAPLGARRIDQAMPDGVILAFVETPDAELPALVARLNRTSAGLAAAEKSR